MAGEHDADRTTAPSAPPAGAAPGTAEHPHAADASLGAPAQAGADTSGRAGTGEETVKVGARDIVRPAGSLDEAGDGEGDLYDRLARKDTAPAGAGDAGVG